MPRNKGQASKEEVELASIHEVGHSLMAESFGLRIYQVAVTRDAGGFSESDLPLAPLKDMQITLAGFVAECIHREVEPTFEVMLKDFTCQDDADEITLLALDGRINPEIAIPRAMQEAYTYLTIPSITRRLKRLAARLSRTRRLDGRIFKYQKE